MITKGLSLGVKFSLTVTSFFIDQRLGWQP
jgi:hypothetical protein